MNYYLGIDFGTSGARGIAINQQQTVVVQVNYSFSNQINHNLGAYWQQALYSLLEQIPLVVRKQIKAIAINGTSSTVLLCNGAGNSIGESLLYNDDRGKLLIDKITNIAPVNHVVISATSSLAKLFWYQQQSFFQQAKYLLHQADWLGFLLHGKLGISDYHNALKLGYDVDNFCYPDWLQNLSFSELFPQVLAPGTPVGEVTPEICDRFSFPADCIVCTGTTDSIAAFLASGATQPGEAVTSLGSTLVLKLLSKKKVAASQYGIYSHRLGDLWLTGGASNTGGAVLKHFFSDRELQELSPQINPNPVSSLEYYPLLKPGERFPINNPNLAPKLSPRPDNDLEFLHGLLLSMARIEALGYGKLQELGATKLTQVYTAGGGAKNFSWEQIRHIYLQVPVIAAKNIQAAYGTALLALKAI
ncbi:Carbohydrate kinase, FGGY [Hyella patelloides LEGE 07179]|uniref:D-ribulose kinase n=1 Tax=Hyella patelloides LEGE 07179 TaxID=945734 RepID=A0A563VXG1_9CYAN|nr:FGGY-family carbohydrate kinase [Hyella patelloides]VEP16106.1 Carbohydrate kinase, FGGY [Hyella patelloides LEGE 07179]